MFPAGCYKFVSDTERDRDVIPSYSLSLAKKTKPLSIAVRWYKRRWIFCYNVQHEITEFKLSDILEEEIDDSDVDLVDDNYCTFNKSYSLVGFFGFDFKNLFASFFGSYEKTITVKFNDLKSRNITPKSLQTTIRQKKVNMWHDLVKQTLQKKDAVLCIVTQVIKTSEQGEITCNSEKKVSGNTQAKATVCDMLVAFTLQDVQNIVLTTETVVAYSVWELKIQTDDGEIRAIYPGGGGGFYPRTDENVDCPTSKFIHCAPMMSDVERFEKCSKNLEHQLQPLLESTKIDKQTLRSVLKQLMECHSDVVILSRLLERAERGNLNENKDKLNEYIVNKENTWNVALRAGVADKEANVVYEGKPTPILAAFAYLIDAMCEVKAHDLVKISECTDEQIKALLLIFKDLIIAYDEYFPHSIGGISSAAHEKPVQDLLESLGIDLSYDSVVFHHRHRRDPFLCETFECIYCILYLLSNMSVKP